MPDSDGSSWRDPLRQFAAYSHVGMMFPIAIALGFFFGHWLDGRLGTAPWLALGGAVLGAVAAIRNLIVTVTRDEYGGTDDGGG